MTRNNKDLRRNDSGCLDLTSYEAIKNLDDERKRYNKFIGCLYRVAELSGYYIEDIVVKDKHTGRLWR